MYVLGTHQAQVERESRGYVQVFPIIPNVAPAGAVRFFGTREQQTETDRESRGYLWLTKALPNVGQGIKFVSTRREFEWEIYNQTSSTSQQFPALQIPPPISIPLEGEIYFDTRQEQPFHPAGSAWNFIPPLPPVVLGPITTFFEAEQEFPDTPISRLIAGIIPPPPTSVAPGLRFFSTLQEGPFHPGPMAWEGNLNLVAPGVRYFSTAQEPPWHPGPLAWNFIPNIAGPGIVGFFSTAQESPDVPSAARAWPSSLNLVAPGVRWFYGSQELPPHPGPALAKALIPLPIIFAAPGIRYFSTTQEMPPNPGSSRSPWPGPFGNGPPTPSHVFEWLIRARRRIRR